MFWIDCVNFLGTSTIGLVLRYRGETASKTDSGNDSGKQVVSWSKIHQVNCRDTAFLVVRLDKTELKFILESPEECRYIWVRSIGNHQVTSKSVSTYQLRLIWCFAVFQTKSQAQRSCPL